MRECSQVAASSLVEAFTSILHRALAGQLEPTKQQSVKFPLYCGQWVWILQFKGFIGETWPTLCPTFLTSLTALWEKRGMRVAASSLVGSLDFYNLWSFARAAGAYKGTGLRISLVLSVMGINSTVWGLYWRNMTYCWRSSYIKETLWEEKAIISLPFITLEKERLSLCLRNGNVEASSVWETGSWPAKSGHADAAYSTWVSLLCHDVMSYILWP